MPNRDGTGPRGQGSGRGAGKGRGRGPCGQGQGAQDGGQPGSDQPCWGRQRNRNRQGKGDQGADPGAAQ